MNLLLSALGMIVATVGIFGSPDTRFLIVIGGAVLLLGLKIKK